MPRVKRGVAAHRRRKRVLTGHGSSPPLHLGTSSGSEILILGKMGDSLAPRLVESRRIHN